MSSHIQKHNGNKQFGRLAVGIFASAACAILLCFAGCKKAGSANSSLAGQASQKQPKFEIDKPYSRGPLTVHIRVDKSKITIADTLWLEFETAIGSGYDVNMPKVDKVLENFGIVDWQNLGNRLDANNNVVSTYRYRLEPFLSGKFAIPAFTFEFRDVNEQAEQNIRAYNRAG